MPVAKQLTIRAADRPGTLARVAEALAKNKINITGVDASGAQGRIRLLVASAARAARVLAKAGIRARLEDVVVVTLGDRPGTLARVARKLAGRGININYAYGTVARGGKRAALVFGVNNPGRVARLIG